MAVTKRFAWWKNLDFILPHGYVEYRRRTARLRNQGLINGRTPGPIELRQIDRAVQTCRFDLLPESVRDMLPTSTVVDVGANKGQFSESLLRLTCPRELILFEPQTCFRKTLERLLEKVSKGRLINSAV